MAQYTAINKAENKKIGAAQILVAAAEKSGSKRRVPAFRLVDLETYRNAAADGRPFL